LASGLPDKGKAWVEPRVIVQRELVIQAQNGDREAFAALASAVIDELYNLAQLMLSDGDLAQDAVQEALIGAWRDLRLLRDPDSFRPWLRRILVHAVYRAARRERRASRVRFAATSDPVMQDAARDLEDRDEIDRVFRRLSAEHRAVIVAHHYLGLSEDEAAEMLGVPPGTVKSRLHRATAAMRAELDAESRRVGLTGVPR
jgi:RNA polymerase sigma-70 factor (ECF subfamily)